MLCLQLLLQAPKRCRCCHIKHAAFSWPVADIIVHKYVLLNKHAVDRGCHCNQLAYPVHAGAFAFLSPKHPARKRAAKLNPQLQRSEPAQGSNQVYVRHNPEAQPPTTKTDQQLRNDALAGDHDFKAGLLHTSTCHSCQRTGVLGSHVFMKLIYWSDAACRDPDCMHNSTGEIKGICDMVKGGTGSVPVYNVSRLPQVAAAYEVHVNRRFKQLKEFAG